MKKLAVLIMMFLGCAMPKVMKVVNEGVFDIESTMFCSKFIDEKPKYESVTYRVIKFTNELVLSQCTVSDNYNESSDSIFYRSENKYAKSANCMVTFDKTGNGGTWVFSKDPTQVIYKDYKNKDNPRQISFDEKDCDIYNYK